MRFKFRVYYSDGSIPTSFSDIAPYKIINARNKARAEIKFKERYPDYRVVSVQIE